uniref:Uncharacterized protein n=1 Tax=Dulem virus 29 TaxID=3145747 RepID=A0AAU8AVH6_9CAUD
MTGIAPPSSECLSVISCSFNNKIYRRSITDDRKSPAKNRAC